MPRNTTNKTYTVHIITHSHLDAGWLQILDECQEQVNVIFSSVVKSLSLDSSRTYTIGDLYFFETWYTNNATQEIKDLVKSLLSSGQLEILHGGSVSPDE